MTIKAKARLKDLAVQLSADSATPAAEASPPIVPEDREMEPGGEPAPPPLPSVSVPVDPPSPPPDMADPPLAADPPAEAPLGPRPRRGVELTMLGIVFSLVFVVFAVFLVILLNEPGGSPLKFTAWRSAQNAGEPGNLGKSLATEPSEPAQAVGPSPANKTRLPETAYTNSIGMTFVRIPKGCFMMGTNEAGATESGLANALSAHQVCIGRDFLLSRTEVTQTQWLAVMETNPSKFEGSHRPVEQVSWMDAQAFVQRLNRREGGHRYRLPTEAEWEYAARANTSHPYVFGDSIDRADEYAWFADNAERQTHPVGQRLPNPWGLQDMQGNVYEWVQDWYEADYALFSPKMDPPGPPAGVKRVIRGGGWSDKAAALHVASRHGVPPDIRGGALGFRVVRLP